MENYLDSEIEGEDFKMYYKLANLDDRIKNADQVGPAWEAAQSYRTPSGLRYIAPHLQVPEPC